MRKNTVEMSLKHSRSLGDLKPDPSGAPSTPRSFLARLATRKLPLEADDFCVPKRNLSGVNARIRVQCAQMGLKELNHSLLHVQLSLGGLQQLPGGRRLLDCTIHPALIFTFLIFHTLL